MAATMSKPNKTRKTARGAMDTGWDNQAERRPRAAGGSPSIAIGVLIGDGHAEGRRHVGFDQHHHALDFLIGLFNQCLFLADGFGKRIGYRLQGRGGRRETVLDGLRKGPILVARTDRKSTRLNSSHVKIS